MLTKYNLLFTLMTSPSGLYFLIQSLVVITIFLYHDNCGISLMWCSSNRSPHRIQSNSSSNRSPYRIQCNSSSNRSPHRIQSNSSSNRSPYRIQCNSSSNRSPYRIQCNSNSNRSPYRIQCNSSSNRSPYRIVALTNHVPSTSLLNTSPCITCELKMPDPYKEAFIQVNNTTSAYTYQNFCHSYIVHTKASRILWKNWNYINNLKILNNSINTCQFLDMECKWL